MGNGNVPTWLMVVIGLVLLANVAYLVIPHGQANVDLSGIESKIDSVGKQTAANAAAIANLAQTKSSNESIEAPINTGSYTLTKGEYEDQAIEAESLRLATESVNSKDFKKAAFEALEDFNVTEVENYKDITVKILDSDVDEDETTFDVKITYFLDGDKDETESARLIEFVVTVDDLDYDDNFVDAEVDDSYLDNLEVLRVYN